MLDLSLGKSQTSPIKGVKLPILKQVNLWDGDDAELPETEVGKDEAPEMRNNDFRDLANDDLQEMENIGLRKIILEPKIKIDL